MVSKYSGLTHANLDPPSAPFTRTPRFQVLLGFKGMSVEVADDSTCGTVFTAASKSRIKGTYRSGGKARRVKSTQVISIPFWRKPVSTVKRFPKLLANRTCPTNSSHA